MKYIGLIFLGITACLLTACGPITDTTKSAENLTSESLVGTWDVALYFSPNDPPSSTVMEISGVQDNGVIEGSFYQSPFELGRFTQQGDELIISVITSDGSGKYFTSGRLSPSGAFIGQTHSEGRDFLMPWTAQKSTQ